MNDFNEHNYLCHYGIKGMKWGIRRLASDRGEHAAKKDYKMLKKENRRIMKESGQAGKTEYNVQKRQQDINLANKTPDFATAVDDRKKKHY